MDREANLDLRQRAAFRLGVPLAVLFLLGSLVAVVLTLPAAMAATAQCSGVQVSPPSGFTQRLVDAQPEGTTFCLGAGTFKMAESVVVPAGDKIVGASRSTTVLDFSSAKLDGQNDMMFGLYGYSGYQDQVTVQHLTIQHCQVPSTNNCLAMKQGSDWIVSDVESRYNDVGLTGNCSGCFIHHNLVYGVSGAGRIEDSEVSFNGGTPDSGGSTGASKTVRDANMTWRGNYIHDNRGTGIWCDACWRDSTIMIENNRIENNEGPGIAFELTWGTWNCGWCGSGYAIARNNTLVGNASADRGKSCFYGGQVSINNSEGIEISGNTIDSSGGTNAICVTDTPRSAHWPTYPEHVAPFTAYNNTIILRGPALVGEAGQEGGGGVPLNATTFLLKNNTYKVDSLSTPHWTWYTSSSPLTFGKWRDQGMDGGSTIAELE